jgi:hypothetical protein
LRACALRLTTDRPGSGLRFSICMTRRAVDLRSGGKIRVARGRGRPRRLSVRQRRPASLPAVRRGVILARPGAGRQGASPSMSAASTTSTWPRSGPRRSTEEPVAVHALHTEGSRHQLGALPRPRVLERFLSGTAPHGQTHGRGDPARADDLATLVRRRSDCSR